MRFSPTSPFGERCLTNPPVGTPQTDSAACLTQPNSTTWDIDGRDRNDSYDCSPDNHYNFVGWPTIYSLYDGLMAEAAANQLVVEEFDLQNEIALHLYPVQARLIVDNTHGSEDVLSAFRTKMSAHYFDPGRVTYSVQASRPISNFGTLGAGYDCSSAYGDSARLADLSMLLAAMKGDHFGSFDTLDSAWQLACGISPSVDTSKLPTLSVAHTLPDIVDAHAAPCMRGDDNTDTGDDGCDVANRFRADESSEAEATFNAFSSLRSSYGQNGAHGYDGNMNNALVMLGETFGHNAAAPGCRSAQWESVTQFQG